MNIQGQVAVITGAASGMGLETAKHLSSCGAKVVMIDLNEEALMAASKALDALSFVCDVSDAAQLENALSQSLEEWGPARIAVNCAGIAPAKKMVGKDGVLPLSDFEKVIKINLIGTFNVMRLVAAQACEATPLGSDAERGVIINTASIAAFEGQMGQVAYSASKGGIVGMTLPAARDLMSRGVRVMTIAPGIMKTPMMDSMPDEVQTSLEEKIPFPKRMGTSKEYAMLVQHIIENQYLNGETIRLDAAIRMSER